MDGQVKKLDGYQWMAKKWLVAPIILSFGHCSSPGAINKITAKTNGRCSSCIWNQRVQKITQQALLEYLTKK
jgi:hypothetical protein